MVKQRYFGSNGCHPTPTQIAIELMAQGRWILSKRLKNLLAKAHRNRLHVGVRPTFGDHEILILADRTASASIY